MTKILIDSDVCLDVLTGRMPFAFESSKVLNAAESGKIKAYISAESFTNIFYVLRKLTSADRAKELLIEIRNLVDVSQISIETVDKALHSNWADFEDAVQYFSALESGCEVIVTRNLNDYKKADIPVMNPAEFLKRRF